MVYGTHYNCFLVLDFMKALGRASSGSDEGYRTKDSSHVLSKSSKHAGLASFLLFIVVNESPVELQQKSHESPQPIQGGVLEAQSQVARALRFWPYRTCACAVVETALEKKGVWKSSYTLTH